MRANISFAVSVAAAFLLCCPAEAGQFLRDIISVGDLTQEGCRELGRRHAIFDETAHQVLAAQEAVESCTKSGCLPSQLATLGESLASYKDANRLASARLQLLSNRYTQIRGDLRTNGSPMVDFVLGKKYLLAEPIGGDYDRIVSPFPTSFPRAMFTTASVRPMLEKQNVRLSVIPDTSYYVRGFDSYSFAYELVGTVGTICDAARSNKGILFSVADHIDKSESMPVPLSLSFDFSIGRSSDEYSLYLSDFVRPVVEQLLYLSPPTKDAVDKYYVSDARCDLGLDKLLGAVGQVRHGIAEQLGGGESWPAPDRLLKMSSKVAVRLSYYPSFTPNVGDNSIYDDDRWTGGLIVGLNYHKHLGDLVLIRGSEFGSDAIHLGIVAVRGAVGEQLYGCDADKALWPH